MAGLASGSVQSGLEPSVAGLVAGSSNWKSIFAATGVDLDPRYKQEFASAAYDIFGGQEDALLTDILFQLGANKETTTSDTISWFEKGRRLQIAVAGENGFTSVVKNSTTHINVIGQTVSWSVGDNLLILDTANSEEQVVRVTGLDPDLLGATIEAVSGDVIASATEVRISIQGNSQPKGSSSPAGRAEIQTEQHSNVNTITRRAYDINNSDKSSLAWFELDGQMYWTNADMENQYKSYQMIKEFDCFTAGGNGTTGFQGVLDKVRTDGNHYDGHPTTLDDWETIIKQIDEVGGRPEYMAMLSRQACLDTDRAMAQYSGSNGAALPNFGDFSMGQKLLDLGFDGFQWGTFKVKYNAWGALTVPTSPMHANNRLKELHGMLLPMGNTPINMNGSAMNVPYMSLLHKVGNGENRELKTTIRGWDSDGIDETKVDWLSEYTTRVACANKIFILENA